LNCQMRLDLAGQTKRKELLVAAWTPRTATKVAQEV
jgi:hypothetical protein